MAEIKFEIVLCATCGIPFGITADWLGRLMKCHNFFYCPSGHHQNYPQESTEERLRRVAQEESKKAGELTIKLMDAEYELKRCLKPKKKDKKK